MPVFGRNRLLGVLHVGSFEARSFTDSDAERLEERAAEIGRRLSERTEDDAHLAAMILQRSLLPAAPPAVEGLDVAVRYLPAEGDLGGDWYDVFTLPSGKTGIVLGDVEGHGLRAAIVMGRLRSALRAYALDHDDPAEVLQRLDRKLCHFETEISATVLYAVTEPPFDQVVICNAGHPAPLSRTRATRRRSPPTSRQDCCWASTPKVLARARRSRSRQALPSRSTPTASWSAGSVPTGTRTSTASASSPYAERSLPATTRKRCAAASLPSDWATTVSRTTSPWS